MKNFLFPLRLDVCFHLSAFERAYSYRNLQGLSKELEALGVRYLEELLVSVLKTLTRKKKQIPDGDGCRGRDGWMYVASFPDVLGFMCGQLGSVVQGSSESINKSNKSNKSH